jgi:hypothetical protein
MTGTIGMAPAVASGGANGSGIVSILIGVVIIIGTVRWSIIQRRNSRQPADEEPPPPVRYLGRTDKQWWAENAGKPAEDEEPEPPAGQDRNPTLS